MKLAIVDDNYERKCRLIINILKREQIDYEPFKSINSFLQTIRAKPDAYEGIFLDMQLPRFEDEHCVVVRNGGEIILKHLDYYNIKLPFILNTTMPISKEKLNGYLYRNMYAQIVGLGTRYEIDVIYSFIRKLSET